MATTTTTTKELEIELGMYNYYDPTEKATRTLTLRDPNTTAAGLSAIKAFNAYLTSGSTSEATAITPNNFFQPTNEVVDQTSNFWVTDTADARIIETTKVTTTVD